MLLPCERHVKISPDSHMILIIIYTSLFICNRMYANNKKYAIVVLFFFNSIRYI